MNGDPEGKIIWIQRHGCVSVRLLEAGGFGGGWTCGLAPRAMETRLHTQTWYVPRAGETRFYT